MNNPPNYNPQQFSQYGTPPPGGNYNPPRNNSGGCWKAAGITCGVLLLLGIIGIIVGVNAFKHSGFGTTIQGVISATQDGQKIQQAVVAYHKTHGKYPDTLTALVADGSIDGKLLHSTLDPNNDPGHISWIYHKPTADTPGYAPLLSLHYTVPIPGQPASQAAGTDLVINLDGSTPQHATTTTSSGG